MPLKCGGSFEAFTLLEGRHFGFSPETRTDLGRALLDMSDVLQSKC
jgi:hypothetical protein